MDAVESLTVELAQIEERYVLIVDRIKGDIRRVHLGCLLVSVLDGGLATALHRTAQTKLESSTSTKG